MAFLIDTNILARLANVADAQYALAEGAIRELHRRGESLFLTAQVLIEFRNLATRPKAINGLGVSAAGAEAKATVFESAFPLLPDTPDIFPAWKAIVSTLGIIGKQVHDALLVAVCHVHSITHLLAFNVSHFARMASIGPGVAVVDPVTV